MFQIKNPIRQPSSLAFMREFNFQKVDCVVVSSLNFFEPEATREVILGFRPHIQIVWFFLRLGRFFMLNRVTVLGNYSGVMIISYELLLVTVNSSTKCVLTG